jgi:cobyrinic acid a,c-diamide synthase
LGPRLVVAGTHSGVGKTTIATGLMAALRHQGHTVRSAKVGPDFIDPGYHALATDAAPRNLDAWICGPEAIGPLAGRASAGGNVLIVEGVMGLFDGAADGTPSSTAEVARMLDAPVVLVVDAASMSASVAALVRGFRDHDPRVQLAGVVLNRVGSDHHEALLREALVDLGVEVLGVVRRHSALTWRDRHLGLVPVAEHPDQARRSIDELAAVIAGSCALERIMAIARSAAPMTVADVVLPARTVDAPVRIAVAGGPAFTFGYVDNLEALTAAGAELVPFDPLRDEFLPANLDGMIVGGGFPEVFAATLAENRSLLGSVRAAMDRGTTTWAECGGLLWLARSLDDHEMAGALDTTACMTTRLTLGYREAHVGISNPVAVAGTVLRGHEFHYSTTTPEGGALALTSRSSQRAEGFATDRLLATYLHLHLGGDPGPAARFVQAGAAARQAALA